MCGYRQELNWRYAKDGLLGCSRTALQLRRHFAGIKPRAFQLQQDDPQRTAVAGFGEKQIVTLRGVGSHRRRGMVHVDDATRFRCIYRVNRATVLVH